MFLYLIVSFGEYYSGDIILSPIDHEEWSLLVPQDSNILLYWLEILL